MEKLLLSFVIGVGLVMKLSTDVRPYHMLVKINTVVLHAKTILTNINMNYELPIS
jgi:hypothetical protein